MIIYVCLILMRVFFWSRIFFAFIYSKGIYDRGNSNKGSGAKEENMTCFGLGDKTIYDDGNTSHEP